MNYLSRIKTSQCKVRDAALQSKQMGNRVNKLTSMEGRTIFDVLQVTYKRCFSGYFVVVKNNIKL